MRDKRHDVIRMNPAFVVVDYIYIPLFLVNITLPLPRSLGT